jgi:hypothetical protein
LQTKCSHAAHQRNPVINPGILHRDTLIIYPTACPVVAALQTKHEPAKLRAWCKKRCRFDHFPHRFHHLSSIEWPVFHRFIFRGFVVPSRQTAYFAREKHKINGKNGAIRAVAGFVNV